MALKYPSVFLAVVVSFVGQPLVLQAAESDFTNSQAQNLLQIYHQAQANDPAWASAQKANQAAQEKIVQGRALLLPTVSLSANANHSDADSNA